MSDNFDPRSLPSALKRPVPKPVPKVPVLRTVPTTRGREHQLSHTDWAVTSLAKLGRNLRVLRKQKGLTLQKLATKTGCSFQVLWHVENGHNFPSLSVYISLCRALDQARPPMV